MARSALAVQDVNRGGLTPAYSAAPVDGHSFQNSGREVIHVKTTSTPCTVTIQTPGTVDGQAIGDRTVVIAGTSERLIGPFPAGTYNQPTGEGVYVDFSAVTGVTVAVFRI